MSAEKTQLKKEVLDGAAKGLLAKFRERGKGPLRKGGDLQALLPRAPLPGARRGPGREGPPGNRGRCAHRQRGVQIGEEAEVHLADPLVIESALQNSGIYGMAEQEINSLPDGVGELVFKKLPGGQRTSSSCRNTPAPKGTVSSTTHGLWMRQGTSIPG